MRRVSVGVAVLLLCAGVPVAQEPPAREAAPLFWEARPFAEWSPAQTLVLLTDSPWSRPATLVEPGVEVHAGKMQYYAQWYSAQVVREALVHLQHLKGSVDPQADNEFLRGGRNAYQLYLFAAFFTESGDFRVVPLEAFEGMSREELEESARLIFSAQEHTARPDLVEFVRQPDTQELVGIRLTFARAYGAVPPGEAQQGQVQLVCPTQRGSFSATFWLEQMRRRGQPEL